MSGTYFNYLNYILRDKIFIARRGTIIYIGYQNDGEDVQVFNTGCYLEDSGYFDFQLTNRFPDTPIVLSSSVDFSFVVPVIISTTKIMLVTFFKKFDGKIDFTYKVYDFTPYTLDVAITEKVFSFMHYFRDVFSSSDSNIFISTSDELMYTHIFPIFNVSGSGDVTFGYEYLTDSYKKEKYIDFYINYANEKIFMVSGLLFQKWHRNISDKVNLFNDYKSLTYNDKILFAQNDKIYIYDRKNYNLIIERQHDRTHEDIFAFDDKYVFFESYGLNQILCYEIGDEKYNIITIDEINKIEKCISFGVFKYKVDGVYYVDLVLGIFDKENFYIYSFNKNKLFFKFKHSDKLDYDLYDCHVLNFKQKNGKERLILVAYYKHEFTEDRFINIFELNIGNFDIVNSKYELFNYNTYYTCAIPVYAKTALKMLSDNVTFEAFEEEALLLITRHGLKFLVEISEDKFGTQHELYYDNFSERLMPTLGENKQDFSIFGKLHTSAVFGLDGTVFTKGLYLSGFSGLFPLYFFNPKFVDIEQLQSILNSINEDYPNFYGEYVHAFTPILPEKPIEAFLKLNSDERSRFTYEVLDIYDVRDKILVGANGIFSSNFYLKTDEIYTIPNGYWKKLDLDREGYLVLNLKNTYKDMDLNIPDGYGIIFDDSFAWFEIIEGTNDLVIHLTDSKTQKLYDIFELTDDTIVTEYKFVGKYNTIYFEPYPGAGFYILVDDEYYTQGNGYITVKKGFYIKYSENLNDMYISVNSQFSLDVEVEDLPINIYLGLLFELNAYGISGKRINTFMTFEFSVDAKCFVEDKIKKYYFKYDFIRSKSGDISKYKTLIPLYVDKYKHVVFYSFDLKDFKHPNYNYETDIGYTHRGIKNIIALSDFRHLLLFDNGALAITEAYKNIDFNGFNLDVGSICLYVPDKLNMMYPITKESLQNKELLRQYINFYKVKGYYPNYFCNKNNEYFVRFFKYDDGLYFYELPEDVVKIDDVYLIENDRVIGYYNSVKTNMSVTSYITNIYNGVTTFDEILIDFDIQDLKEYDSDILIKRNGIISKISDVVGENIVAETTDKEDILDNFIFKKNNKFVARLPNYEASLNYNMIKVLGSKTIFEPFIKQPIPEYNYLYAGLYTTLYHLPDGTVYIGGKTGGSGRTVSAIAYPFKMKIKKAVMSYNGIAILTEDNELYVGYGYYNIFGSVTTPSFYNLVLWQTDVVDVGVTSQCCIFKKSDGSVYGSGKNYYGELGLGHTNSVNTPTLLSAEFQNFQEIYNGEYTFIFKGQDGKLYLTGEDYGFSGLPDCGSVQIRLTPVALDSMFNNPNYVALGYDSLFIATANNDLYFLNYGSGGSSGTGTNNYYTDTPTLVGNFGEIKKIVQGYSWTVILLKTGQLLLTGNFYEPVFNNGLEYSFYFSSDHTAPVDIIDICGGFYNLLMLDKYGNLYGFGRNYDGELLVNSNNFNYFDKFTPLEF
jgi:hypothetical protein